MPTHQAPHLSGRALRAAGYAAVVFGVTAGSAVLRLVLHRVLAMPPDDRLAGPIILAALLGLLWFVLALVALARSNTPAQDQVASGTKPIWRTIAIAAVMASVLAISAWMALYLNDEIFYSRSLPLIAPLITLQSYGFGKASQLFPCQAEGFDTGCEAYKRIPAFLVSNSLVYFPFVLVGLFSLQSSETMRKALRSAARYFARWSAPVVGAGLLTLQVMHALNLATYDSLYPHPGIAHWHFGVWEQVNDITGTVIVIAGLLFPFYLCRIFRRPRSQDDVRSRIAEATSLAATMLLALMLGNVY